MSDFLAVKKIKFNNIENTKQKIARIDTSRKRKRDRTFNTRSNQKTTDKKAEGKIKYVCQGAVAFPTKQVAKIVTRDVEETVSKTHDLGF